MLDPSQIDGVVLRLDCIKRYLVNISDDLQTDVIVSQLQQVIDSLQEERNQYENREGHRMAAKLNKQTRGWPSFDIKEETLSFLLEMGFKVIAQPTFCCPRVDRNTSVTPAERALSSSS